MKRFKFSLQAVHNHRTLERELAETEFAQIAAAISNAEAAVDQAVQAREAATRAYLAAIDSGKCDGQDLALRVSHIARLADRETENRRSVMLLRQVREHKHKAMVAATRAEKVTSNLRDRHRLRFIAETGQFEQAALDEFANMAYARRNRQ